MRTGEHGFLTLLTLAAICAGCGSRSGLLAPFQSDAPSGGGDGGSALGGQGGQAESAGRGGSFSTAGTFADAGTNGVAGTYMAGGALGSGGEPGTCLLASADCATPHEPKCLNERPECTGEIATVQRFDSTLGAYVYGVATARDGRVAITGVHLGTTIFGDQVLTSPPSANQPYGQEAFVASFDSQRTLQWIYRHPGPGEAQGRSLAFAPNGDSLMQASSIYDSATASVLVRLSPQGKQAWRQDWGTISHQTPTGLAVDNDDRIWLSGSFDGLLGFPGSSLSAVEQSGYLLRVDDVGALLGELTLRPPSWRRDHATAVAVDDEDNVLVSGAGDATASTGASYVHKFSADGDALFQKTFGAGLRITTVVVDRLMRVTVLGQYEGTFENEGARFESAASSLWLAQYSREGALLWQKSYDGDAVVDAAAVDPFGNIIVVGLASRLAVGPRTLRPGRGAELGFHAFNYALKLRPDGTDVWAQTMDGQLRWAGVASDNRGTIWLAGTFIGRVWLGDVNLGDAPVIAGLLVSVKP